MRQPPAMSGTTALRLARLGYWLSPLAPQKSKPRGVTRIPVAVAAERDRDSYLYRPVDGIIRGAWLLSPGLHYHGPEDPRVDRLASILAADGNLVLSPAIPDLMELRLAAGAIDDLARAFDTLVAQPELPADCRPGVFSVSVGSMAALHLARRIGYGERISRLVSFGGYIEPEVMLRALIEGDPERDLDRPWDPLNQPTVFATVLDHLPVTVRDPIALRAAWRRYVEKTWPRPELKKARSTAHHVVARSLVHRVARADRELFLTGCGVLPGGYELCAAAFAAPGRPYAYLDPRSSALATWRAEVSLIHGFTDPVIPFTQMAAMRAAIPHARTMPLGLYSHSAPASGRDLWRILPNAASEVRTMLRVLGALA